MGLTEVIKMAYVHHMDTTDKDSLRLVTHTANLASEWKEINLQALPNQVWLTDNTRELL